MSDVELAGVVAVVSADRDQLRAALEAAAIEVDPLCTNGGIRCRLCRASTLTGNQLRHRDDCIVGLAMKGRE